PRMARSATSTTSTGGGSAQARSRPARMRARPGLESEPWASPSRCLARFNSSTRVMHGSERWPATGRWSSSPRTAASTGAWFCCRARSGLDVSDYSSRLRHDLAILLDARLAERKPSRAVARRGAHDQTTWRARTVIIDVELCGRRRLAFFGKRERDRRERFVREGRDGATVNDQPAAGWKAVGLA